MEGFNTLATTLSEQDKETRTLPSGSPSDAAARAIEAGEAAAKKATHSFNAATGVRAAAKRVQEQVTKEATHAKGEVFEFHREPSTIGHSNLNAEVTRMHTKGFQSGKATPYACLYILDPDLSSLHLAGPIVLVQRSV